METCLIGREKTQINGKVLTIFYVSTEVISYPLYYPLLYGFANTTSQGIGKVLLGMNWILDVLLVFKIIHAVI